MKAKIFVGRAATGKTSAAGLVAKVIGGNRVLHIYPKSFIQALDTCKSKAINNDIQLAIIDECPYDFDYTKLYDTVVLNNNNEPLYFKLKYRRPYSRTVTYYPATYYVPFLIFITQELDEKYKNDETFNTLFDVIEFPIIKIL